MDCTESVTDPVLRHALMSERLLLSEDLYVLPVHPLCGHQVLPYILLILLQ